MSLSSRFENIEMAQHLCGRLLEGRDVPEETRHWILMAAARGPRQRHQARQSRRINPSTCTSRWTSSADTLVISIRDEGGGSIPAAVEDPLAPENRLKTSGRGIFYMKTFMDEVRFRRHAEGGMEIVLKKNLGRIKEKEENPA